MSSYATAAQVLRMLAGSAEAVVLNGSTDPIRFILLTAAEACEQVASANQARDEALGLVTDLRDLLGRAIDVLEECPLPSDGGSWAIFTLAEEIRRALGQAEQV